MDNTLLLWLDFEATGLHPMERDVILEAAWTITDANLSQITPLRSRFTRLEPQEHMVGPIAPVPSEDDWHSMRVAPVVREMHDKSGLAEQWAAAWDGMASADWWRVIRNGEALEQMISNDIGEALDYKDEGTEIMLAGLGVSHFDQNVLAYHCPRLAPTPAGRLHYATFDPSVAGRVLKAPKCDRALITELIENGLVDDPSISGEFADYDPRQLVEHRAADDVVMGLLYAQWLRGRSL